MLFRAPLPRPGHIQRYAGLTGSSDALALAQLAATTRPLLVITETALEAQRLRDEIPCFAPDLSVHLFPDWETLPYDQFSPHQDLVSERLATLYQIDAQAFDIAIVPVATALYRLPPKEFLAAHTFFLKQGTRLDTDALRKQLTLASYTHVSQVQAPGEYSVRGGVIDLFPMGSPVPYRIDLFDEEVETIRTFDVDTQRSIYPVKDVRLLPAREFPLNESGIACFRQKFRDRFEGDPSRSKVYKDVSNGIAPPGVEYYLPLFFDETATFTDYLPHDALICLHHGVLEAGESFWRDTRSRHSLLRGDRDRPLLPPEELFVSVDQLFGALKEHPRLEILAPAQGLPAHTEQCATAALPPIHVDRRAEQPLAQFQQFIAGFHGRILIAAESVGRRETMAQMFDEHGIKPAIAGNYADFLARPDPLMLAAVPVSLGFVLPDDKLALVTEAELYALQVRQSRLREAKKTSTEHMLRDLSEVRVGDPVVHEDHGIARYQGLVTMDLGEGDTEFLLLEYAGGDKLYVPVANLHLISRYSGGPPETAPLHKLGSGQWEKAKRKAAKQVRDTAAELLNLYAQRAARQGHAFQFKPHDYEAFAAGFEFEETPDQAAAIQAVIEDMTRGKPMDRLVCGDVGFGKTEVALRAAFLAVADNKQVAVLVPTTLLAEQHYHTFSDRFGEWPVKVAEISRFRTAKEQAQALQGVKEGKIDILIGTHRLLQKDVEFKNLGLVIIDEEHRFGVRQKERLKSLRAEVDVLTLTATPIPRTLSMAMEGLRDFSVIATAPQKRLAIKTFVHPWSDGLVREAVLRELKRGGQVYFLHNEVETIHNMHERLEKLLPEARITIAHGQMRERELEHVMRDFYHQRFNVLLCTTIIETGIDIPSANTIIMTRADKFGLAQLHQLRGRVGRSHHQAYAYLLTPEGGITSSAKKRLEAIQMMEDLGVGFHLAMHDLEIRGAGELLGEGQSGEMQEIGFTLYADMLNNAVKALKAGKEPDMEAPLNATTEINLHAPALLPNDYCSDVHERLVLYKRLANCDTLDELDALHEELIDRFGLLPAQARTLLDVHRLRILAKEVGVARIDAHSDAITLQFVPQPPIDPARIIELIQKKKHYKLAGQDKLKVTLATADTEKRARAVQEIFRELQG
jgi:transcription-repair coupling factor (superfamily II helicase)